MKTSYQESIWASEKIQEKAEKYASSELHDQYTIYELKNLARKFKNNQINGEVEGEESKLEEDKTLLVFRGFLDAYKKSL